MKHFRMERVQRRAVWVAVLAAAVFLGNPRPAPGYLTKTAGGNTVCWRSGSGPAP